MPPQNDDWFSQNAPKAKPKPAAQGDWFAVNSAPPKPLRTGSPLPGLVPDPNEQARASGTPRGMRPVEDNFQSQTFPSELGFAPPSGANRENAESFARGLNNPLGTAVHGELQRRAGEQYNAGNPVRGYLTDVAGNAAEFAGGATDPKNAAIAAGVAASPWAAAAAVPYFLYEGGKAILTEKQPGETEAEYRRRQLYGGAAVAGTAAMVPGATKTLRAAPQTLRETIQRRVKAGPAQVERAAGDVAAERSATEAENAKIQAETKATAENQAKLIADENAAKELANLEKQTASDVNWEQGTRDKALEYFKEFAENEKKHAETTKAIEQENATAQQAVQRRTSLETELEQDATTFADRLKQTAEAAEQAAKEMYPEITGEVDAVEVGQKVQQAVDQTLKGSGRVPDPIQRIQRDYTPVEQGIEVNGEIVEPGTEMWTRLQEQGALPEGMGATPEKATVEMLHGQYSELGRAWYDAQRRGAPGDEVAALSAARNVIGDYLKGLYKQAGRLPEFNAAQQNYAKVMTRFYDRTSPIARLLEQFDPARAQTGGQARPAGVQRILKNTDAQNILRRYLKDYPDAPVDVLEQILAKAAERDALPKKFTPKQIPLKPKVNAPDLPLRETVPPPTLREGPNVDALMETARRRMQPGPKPFDKSQFIRDQVQKAAENLQASGGMLTSVPRHIVGRILERPGVKNWIANEPPSPLRPGASSPYRPPPTQGGTPPPSGPPGPPPNVTPPQGAPAPLRGKPGAGSAYEPPPETPRGPDRRTGGGSAATERRVGGRRAEDILHGPLTPDTEVLLRAQTMQMPAPEMTSAYLKKLGVNIGADELRLERGGATLHAEVTNILDELGTKKLNAAQIRSIKDVLSMKNLDPYEVGTRLRQRLGLETGE